MKHALLILVTVGLPLVVGCARRDTGENPAPLPAPASSEQPKATLPKAAPVEELKEPKTKTLFQAAMLGNVNDVRVYLRRNPESVDRPDAAGRFPLHLAADRGHSEVIRVLLRAGADVNTAHAKVQATPLQYAATGGHLDAVRTLLN